MAKKDDPQFKIRMPAEMKDWIDRQADLNRSSMSSEIVRCIRERKERVEQGAAA